MPAASVTKAQFLASTAQEISTMESMDGHSSRWLLGHCLHCDCKSWFPIFASQIFSFFKSDLLLLQVGFVPFASQICSFASRICSFYKPWFPPFGSGRQNWTGRRQNAVTNRPETGLWQPCEYFLAHHFQLKVKTRDQSLATWWIFPYSPFLIKSKN